MRMTMKVVFDPLTTAGSQLAAAVQAVDAKVEITFHNSRETADKPKAKPVKVTA